MAGSISLTSPAMMGHQPSDRLRQQAVDLEGVFLNTLVKEMFASAQSKDEFDGGYAEETWRGMQAEQLANVLAQSGGVGIADSLMPDLLALQEAATSGPQVPPQGAYR